jgi:biotin operon repressor|tara:strand:+ start:178 stop:348 length:171 start_codon:yes stop_codon:yes gene_type:complete
MRANERIKKSFLSVAAILKKLKKSRQNVKKADPTLQKKIRFLSAAHSVYRYGTSHL